VVGAGDVSRTTIVGQPNQERFEIRVIVGALVKSVRDSGCYLPF